MALPVREQHRGFPRTTSQRSCAVWDLAAPHAAAICSSSEGVVHLAVRPAKSALLKTPPMGSTGFRLQALYDETKPPTYASFGAQENSGLLLWGGPANFVRHSTEVKGLASAGEGCMAVAS